MTIQNPNALESTSLSAASIPIVEMSGLALWLPPYTPSPRTLLRVGEARRETVAGLGWRRAIWDAQGQTIGLPGAVIRGRVGLWYVRPQASWVLGFRMWSSWRSPDPRAKTLPPDAGNRSRDPRGRPLVWTPFILGRIRGRVQQQDISKVFPFPRKRPLPCLFFCSAPSTIEPAGYDKACTIPHGAGKPAKKRASTTFRRGPE